jgi:hypothetical protein
MAQSLRINGKYYPTKKAALDYFGGILGRYGVGELIARDHDDLEDLLKYHTNAKEKCGMHINCFKVDMITVDDFNTKCFYVKSKDPDGEYSYKDFSFIKIIKNYSPFKKLNT